MTRTRNTLRFLGITLALIAPSLSLFPHDARAGYLQDAAVKIASVATGMPQSSWRLDITNDMPTDAWGYWDPNVDSHAARVRPLNVIGDYSLWCETIVHEAWHIKNQNPEHSSDPNNVLYPDIVTPTNYIYPPCLEVPIVPHTNAAAKRSGRRPDHWHSRHRR